MGQGLAAAVVAEIKAERERRGMTQRQVYTAARIPEQTYLRIEAGQESSLTVARMEAVAAALGLDPALLLARAVTRMAR